jgi:N-acetylneuraminic acid mutarotase
LHFTELNKFAAGARVFDVAINGTTVLGNFDVFVAAGGAYRTVVRTFPTAPVNGKITIAFIARVENAKVDAIELVPSTPSSTTTSSSTTSSSTTTTSTSTTVAPTTSTTATPNGDFRNVSWTAMANSPFASVEGAGGMLNGKLYNFGGYEDPSWTNPNGKSASYDVTTNTWTVLPSMPRGLTHAGRVIDGNSFILLGGVAAEGTDQTHAVTDAYRYDTITKQWSTFPALPQARGSGTAALVGRKLHFIGGVDAAIHEHADHWVIDLDNLGAGWSTAPAFPQSRSHFASLVIDNSIYTFGGQHGWEETASPLSDVYRYDTTTQTWSKMADIPLALSHIEESTVRIGGKVWVFGGEHEFAKGGTTDIYIYDIAGNTWTKSASKMPAIREAAIIGVQGSTVYEAFGEWTAKKAWKGALS